MKSQSSKTPSGFTEQMCPITDIYTHASHPCLPTMCPMPPPPLPETGNSPVSGTADPRSSQTGQVIRGSVDTTKTRSGPQRVRMCGGERPMGTAKGKQTNTVASCQPPPPFPLRRHRLVQSPLPGQTVNCGASGGACAKGGGGLPHHCHVGTHAVPLRDSVGSSPTHTLTPSVVPTRHLCQAAALHGKGWSFCPGSTSTGCCPS